MCEIQFHWKKIFWVSVCIFKNDYTNWIFFHFLPSSDTEEATNGERTERIERLIQDIILAQRNPEKLPNVILNKPSLSIESEFTCPEGFVVKVNACVPCPKGTKFDVEDRTCTPCEIGTFNSKENSTSCEVCPQFRGKPAVTETLGSTSVNQCKERCEVGQFFDNLDGNGLCRNCGNGKYQPEEGKFSCRLCGVGLTTRTDNAVSADECREECSDGKQLAFDGNCEPCPVGTYRKKGTINKHFCPWNQFHEKPLVFHIITREMWYKYQILPFFSVKSIFPSFSFYLK